MKGKKWRRVDIERERDLISMLVINIPWKREGSLEDDAGSLTRELSVTSNEKKTKASERGKRKGILGTWKSCLRRKKKPKSCLGFLKRWKSQKRKEECLDYRV